MIILTRKPLAGKKIQIYTKVYIGLFKSVLIKVLMCFHIFAGDSWPSQIPYFFFFSFNILARDFTNNCSKSFKSFLLLFLLIVI